MLLLFSLACKLEQHPSYIFIMVALPVKRLINSLDNTHDSYRRRLLVSCHLEALETVEKSAKLPLWKQLSLLLPDSSLKHQQLEATPKYARLQLKIALAKGPSVSKQGVAVMRL